MTSSEWEAKAKSLGYTDEREMWKALYPKNSLSQLAEQFKLGINTIRNRVDKAGVEIAKRGGANNTKVELDEEFIKTVTELGVMATAKKLGVKPQSIYSRLYYQYGLSVRQLKANVEEALREANPTGGSDVAKAQEEDL